MSEMDHGGHVHLEHFEQGLPIGAKEFAVISEAGIVYQDFDRQLPGFGELENVLGRRRVCEVCREDFRLTIAARTQLCSQRGKAICSARGQNEVSTRRGQLPGKLAADAGTCSGYERP